MGAPRRATVLKGAAASEAAFKVLAPDYDVVHVATHGFFLNASCEPALELDRQPSGGAPAAPDVVTENPLVLAGLALAGVNRREIGQADQEDGVLTADEIAALDLARVRWAVLSACETGLGEATSGEGVLGMRRAFRIAGARTLIMSLWPVEDQVTREWMESLYQARLRRAQTTAESVRSASRALLEARRRAGKSTHPFYWGAFVAAGDWR